MGRSRRRPASAGLPAAVALEPRVFLSAAVTSGNPAEVARGPMAKIGSDLATDYQQAAGGTVAVNAYATPGHGSALARAERRLGATDVVVHGTSVDARVPVAQLARLAGLASVRFARPDQTIAHAGAVTSQGDVSDRAAAARSLYGVTGAGVTVGILSDSFNDSGDADTYATDVATGDLPAGVQVLAEDPTRGTDEGRAIAQTVYDSAPGASLAFATAEGGQAAMAANIGALVKAGAKVIVDDVSYLAEPMFEDGPIAQAVAAATAAGVTYFAAAGDTASDAYASTWRSSSLVEPAGAFPSAAGAPKFYGGTFFNFATDGSDQPVNTFTLGPGQSITLSMQWDSPYYSVSGGSGSPNQVDAYVFNNGQVVGGGVNYDVGGDPVQVFTYTNTTGATAQYGLSLVSESGAVPGYVKYVDFAGQATGWTFGYNAGTVFGHANAASAGAGLEAVGAASYLQTPAYGVTPPVLEPTSATGTTPIFFNTAGTRLATPVVRQSPGLVAPDGGDTTFFGQQTSDGDSYPNFFGTSAAAAAAAGVAALLLQANSTLTPAAADAALQSTAVDMGTPGVDAQSGYGLIQADAAIAATLGTVTGTVFQDNNGNGTLDGGEPGEAGVTVFVDANGNGVRDAGERSTVTAANGTFTLANLPAAADTIRVVVPNGTAATLASRTAAVTANVTTAGVNLGLFPTVFTGTAGNDTYVLQVDPTNKADDDVIFDGTTTYTAAKALLESAIFSPGTGDDTLTISDLNGNPLATSGGYVVTFDGGAGTNGLVLDGGTGADQWTVNAQQTTFDSGNVLGSDISSETINGDGGSDETSVTQPAAAGQTVTFNGGVGSSSFNVRANLANNGAGYVYNAGTAAGESGNLNVNVGTYALAGDPALTSANLTVNVSTTLILSAAAAGTGVNARHLAAINVGSAGVITVAAPPTHADRAVVVTNSLAVTAGGKVNLAGNDMVVQAGALATASALAATGYAGGAWTGAGLQSSAAAADTSHLTALGVIANTPAGATAPLYSAANPFDGVAPAPAAVLVKYTYYGDANLDGVVNVADYTRADAGFLAGLTGWANGDYDYDNVVDGSDYTLIDNAFNQQPVPL